MKDALSTLILAGLASAQGASVDSGPTRPPSSARQSLSSQAEGDGGRGFRQAERVLAAATAIGSRRSRYLGRVAEGGLSIWDRSRSETCDQGNSCTYLRYFDISVGARTKLALLFDLRLPEASKTVCGDPRPDKPCSISASVFLAGDEAFPLCVGVDPIRRAAIRHGWSLHPYRHPPYDENSSRYRRADDQTMYLFIRTTDDDRCFRSIHIARIPGI
ncbi:MAG TPA: hypothetical protein VFZ91_07670 [Allosphingosinicella sp.]